MTAFYLLQRLNSLKLFVSLSFFFAIAGGFALAGHLSSVLALGFPIKASFPALVQSHGHLQILGWVGLLIMGISIEIVPRLVSRPISVDSRLIALLVGSGLAIRSLSQLLLPYLNDAKLNLAFFLGSLMESSGIALYLAVLFFCFKSAKASTKSAISRLLPYFLVSLLGWVLFLVLNFNASLDAFLRTSFILSPNLKQLQTDIFLYLTLIPLSLVFSVKLLPLFLGLREPRWAVGKTGILIAAASMLKVVSLIMAIDPLRLIATAMLFSGITAFIWQLDLFHRNEPERLQPLIENNSLRGRGLLPDRGEYGRFELHIYVAYLWLFIASAMDLLSSSGLSISSDAIRHTYLLGFISNLIFGVGIRLLPGMLGSRLKNPGLADATFILLNTAAIGRILPFFLQDGLKTVLIKWLFASSGSLALLAISIMAYNIYTGQRKR